MPRAVQLIKLGGIECAGIQAPRPEDLVQVLPVNDIEAHEGPISPPDHLHSRLVERSPFIREALRVSRQGVAAEEAGDLARDAGSPVDDCPERVEKERTNSPETALASSARHDNPPERRRVRLISAALAARPPAF